jgi:hypothetical protein
MYIFRVFPLMTFLLSLLITLPAATQQKTSPPLPAIQQLMREVAEHQKALEKVVENYTYSSLQTTQDLDSNGRVKKTETEESEIFYVKRHPISRTVKKNGQPLSGHDLDKENERVVKEVEKAEKPGKPKDGQQISISRILEIIDVRNPRRESYRGRSTIVFDFAGRKDAKTHGMGEEVCKKLEGTMWIDEADRQIAHIEAHFDDNFRLAGGLVASIEKGTSIRFDQAPVNGEIWLPTGAEGTGRMRLFLFKGLRQHFIERDYGYKRFHVETQQVKDAKVVPGKKS